MLLSFLAKAGDRAEYSPLFSVFICTFDTLYAQTHLLGMENCWVFFAVTGQP